MVACAIAAGVALMLYGNDLARAEQVFFLKYLFSSQSAILWMSALFALAMVCYWIGFVSPTAAWLGTALTWGAVFAGTTGMLVRWREGHLMGPDLGHIPVSNLYEVFVLFALITALFYLYYERKYATRALGGFVLLVVTSAVVFLLWYSFTRDAGQIQPLVPALKSWWMKLHVPANFIGYGTFSLAAMVGFAYLVKQHGQTSSWLAGAAVRAGRAAVRRTHGVPLGRPVGHLDAVFRHRRGDRRRHPAGPAPHRRRAAVAGGAGRHHVSRHRHRLRFFTVATILGALWAADAWGAYWQWDPKETWALIVWLNYAAWLHMRLIKGLRGTMAAYWALTGLLITGFAFLGVNMYLSGLHSYGQL